MTIESVDKNKCTGCLACANVCPKACISVYTDTEGFIYPQINHTLCIDCGLCKITCPVLNSVSDNKSIPSVFAAYNTDNNIRNNSSSGGIYSAFCKYFISNGGVVFGAQFNDDFKTVFHSYACDDSYSKFTGAKYIQSDIKMTFKEVKEFLNINRFVLFCGTPCQIEGLFKYLGRPYETLLTIDFICHGVGSPIVWQKYIEKYNNINNVSFRNKNRGWKNYCMSIQMDSNSLIEDHNNNKYMRLYLNNIILRPSCYSCQFKKVHRISDITISDFWKVQECLPEMDDDRGTSLIFVHSNKGRSHLECISNSLVMKEVSYNDVVQYNTSMIMSADKPHNRDRFFSVLNNKGFEQSYKICCGNGIKKWIKDFVFRSSTRV